MSFNKVIVVGNLGRDPELRYTPQGLAVCTFTVATNEKRKDKDGNPQEVVTWFRCTAWRNAAENVSKYLSKGSPIYVEGRLRVDEWTDRENNNRYTLDVQVSDVQFLGGGSKESGADGTVDGAPPEENPTGTPEAGEGFSGPPADDKKWAF